MSKSSAKIQGDEFPDSLAYEGKHGTLSAFFSATIDGFSHSAAMDTWTSIGCHWRRPRTHLGRDASLPAFGDEGAGSRWIAGIAGSGWVATGSLQ